jgi:hypothetical protein
MPEKAPKGKQKQEEGSQTGSEDEQDLGSSRTEETPDGSDMTKVGWEEPSDEGDPADQGGRQGDFNHSTLAGRSPQEVEAYVKLLEGTVREQKDQLTHATSPPPPADAGESRQGITPEVSDADFWKNPVQTNQKVFKQLLEETIAPFRQDLARTQQAQVRTELRAELPDFERYEPYIDQMLANGQFGDAPNRNVLRMLYFTARGYVHAQGGEAPPPRQPSTREGNMGHPERKPSAPPPQHRPSSTPLPKGQDGQPKLRDLTENEKVLARSWGMSKEEYLSLQEAPADEFMQEESDD